jgi:CHASE2 domain-containing sensor protein
MNYRQTLSLELNINSARFRRLRQDYAWELSYWLSAVALIIWGIWYGDRLQDGGFALAARYRATELLQGAVQREIHARRVTLVKIGDTEFWKAGDLDRRIPIKRSYIARLIRALDKADPCLIAIDYNFRSPVPSGELVESPSYRRETDELLAAIDEVSQRRLVVLPATFNEEITTPKGYPLDSAIYSGHHFASDKLLIGFLNFMRDLRRVPITVRIQGQKQPLQSFSLAIARAVDPDVFFTREENLQTEYVALGPFMTEKNFSAKRWIVNAGDVLADSSPAWRSAVRCRIAIIGSFCHRDAFERGVYLDQFNGPGGPTPGVIVHANYVEAWLDSRVIPRMTRWTANSLELLIALLVSWLFFRGRFNLLWFSGILLGMIASGYLLLVNFAIFFDWYLPVLFAAFHGFIENMREWKTKADTYDELALHVRRGGTA